MILYVRFCEYHFIICCCLIRGGGIQFEAISVLRCVALMPRVQLVNKGRMVCGCYL